MKKENIFVRLYKNKVFCLFWLIFGCTYVTWYGAFPELTYGITGVYKATASQIGLSFPWHFKMWGIFSAIALSSNILYAYRRYGYKSKFGVGSMIFATCCICTTVNIPSTEIMSLQLVAHWSTALLFAVFYAVALGLLLLNFAKTDNRFKATFIVFAIMLAAMIALLVAFGKNGAIENIPIWGTYLILFLLNYTGIYKKTAVPAEKDKKETAKV